MQVSIAVRDLKSCTERPLKFAEPLKFCQSLKKNIANCDFWPKVASVLPPPAVIYVEGWALLLKCASLPMVVLKACSSFVNWGWWTGLGTNGGSSGVRWMSTLWSFKLNGYSDCLVSHGFSPMCVLVVVTCAVVLNGTSTAYWRQVVSSSCWAVLWTRVQALCLQVVNNFVFIATVWLLWSMLSWSWRCQR